MTQTLKEHVVPVLRKRGFEGRFPHYRRRTERAIHLLVFQFDEWEGRFIVEIAICPPEGARTSWGTPIPPTKVRIRDTVRSLSLGAPDEQSDGVWFKYDQRRRRQSPEPYEKAALAVLPFLEGQAEAWWKRETDAYETSA
jgi:hypothetical protein